MKQELYISDNLCTNCPSYRESFIRCRDETEEKKYCFCTYIGQVIVGDVVECSARDAYEIDILNKKNDEVENG